MIGCCLFYTKLRTYFTFRYNSFVALEIEFIWGCPRPSALLRVGVGLSRAPLRCGAAHSSRWSLPFYPSPISPATQRSPWHNPPAGQAAPEGVPPIPTEAHRPRRPPFRCRGHAALRSLSRCVPPLVRSLCLQAPSAPSRPALNPPAGSCNRDSRCIRPRPAPPLKNRPGRATHPPAGAGRFPVGTPDEAVLGVPVAPVSPSGPNHSLRSGSALPT